MKIYWNAKIRAYLLKYFNVHKINDFDFLWVLQLTPKASYGGPRFVFCIDHTILLILRYFSVLFLLTIIF